jgi:hypothetical protein
MSTWQVFLLFVTPAMGLLIGGCYVSPPQPVGSDEAATWMRSVIPLPKQAAIESKVLVRADKVSIALRPEASELERCAAGELAELFKEKTGKEIAVVFDEKKGGAFQIVIGTSTENALAQSPCPEQAYMIFPRGEQALVLTGPNPKGVYYAAKTLKQLLAAAFVAQGNKTVVAIPLANITDWPDLPERGLWGGSANQDIEWMAERKMNLVESHVNLTVDEQGKGVAKIPDGLLARAQRHAVNLVPIITHLEQLPGDVFARFPELKGVGDPEAWKKVGFITPACFSQPKAQEILSDWLTCLAKYPEVTDINVWLSENDVSCQCPKCKAVNTFVLQTQLALRAWEAAKKVRPDIRLRLLLTQGSYKYNDQVLATAPRTVGITYYDGGRTYNSSRDPMIYPLLEDYAAKGGWLGCYPQLTASWRIVCPWSGPQFIKARMTEFVSKKLKCLCGYATPSNRFYDFNVTAAAEWSWNARGRSERDFAVAWATREGLADPEMAADWAVMLGPVGWDVYGSSVPYRWVYGNITGTLKAGKPPKLGAGIYTYFPTKESLDRDIAVCDKAMGLAQQLKAPALIEETRVVRGFVAMLKGIYLMSEALAAGQKMTQADKVRATAALGLMDEGSLNAHDGLLAWGEAVAPERMPGKGKADSRLVDTANCIDDVMAQASDVAYALGVKDKGRAYRTRKIGGWKTEDFKAGRNQKMTWEVTSYVDGPGRYNVFFYYESGWYGAGINRVALVASPENAARLQVEIACDPHHGSTGYSPKNTTYELVLNEYSPKRKYYIVADLEGIPPNSPPDKQGCTGFVKMCKVRE